MNIIDDTMYGEFDFDTWSAMARSDPQAFETCRRHLFSQCIEQGTPHAAHIQSLQAQLDVARITSPTTHVFATRLADLLSAQRPALVDLAKLSEQLAETVRAGT